MLKGNFGCVPVINASREGVRLLFREEPHLGCIPQGLSHSVRSQRVGKGGSLARITEKPQYSFLVDKVMYVVRRDRLGLIPERTRCDMTEFIEQIKNAGGRIGVFPIGENAWIDTGEWAEYRKALEVLGRLGARTTVEWPNRRNAWLYPD